MTVVIKRNFKRSADESGFLNLTDEALERAKKYLLSCGYSDKSLQPIVWPDDAVSAYQAHCGAPWEFTTRADVKKKRQMDGGIC